MRYLFHELRNPLNSLALGIDILHRRWQEEYTSSNKLGEGSSPSLQLSSKETLLLMKHSVTYINDSLQDVSQMDLIEDGQLVLNKVKFPLMISISNVITPLQELAETRGIRLCVEYEDLPYEVRYIWMIAVLNRNSRNILRKKPGFPRFRQNPGFPIKTPVFNGRKW